MSIPKPLRVHGLDLSYFTGKLEGYLRGKGIAYELIEMDTGDFKRCGKATGVAQMPQVEWHAGQWLSDTTLIIPFLEDKDKRSTITPSDPMTVFMAQLLEDFADEWLWRPALVYRWANAKDARLMGQRLAEGMMRDVPLPTFLRRILITARQRLHFLFLDGFTRSTRKRIEAHYTECLSALEKVLAQQAYVLGERPTLADYGFFGSMFRHFFSDPTPAGIMRRDAPNVMEWVARLWNVKLDRFEKVPFTAVSHQTLAPLLRILIAEFIPYMQANEEGVLNGQWRFVFNSQGTRMKIPTHRYRAWRYQRLRLRFQALPAQQRAMLALEYPELNDALKAPVNAPVDNALGQLPIAAQRKGRFVGRTW